MHVLVHDVALLDCRDLCLLGAPVEGLRGTAATSEGAPARAAFDALWKRVVKGAKPYTGFEGTAFDAANLAFLAAVKACSATGPKIKAQLRAVSADTRKHRSRSVRPPRPPERNGEAESSRRRR